MRELHEKISVMNSDYYTLRGEIVSAERHISKFNERLSMWDQYSKNKAVHQRLAAMKPKAQEKYQTVHSAELVLYNTAKRYLDVLKASGEAITPKNWQAEVEHLTARKNEQYGQMWAMREDIKVVEKIRKTADQLAKAESRRDREHDR